MTICIYPPALSNTNVTWGKLCGYLELQCQLLRRMKSELSVQRLLEVWLVIVEFGYGDLVVMSIETYEQIVETQTIDNAISEAEEEYDATGILLDAKETLASLRRKHFG